MSSTQSSSPTYSTTTCGPRSVIVMAIGCALFGGFFYLLYGQLGAPSSDVIEEVTQPPAKSEATTRGEFQHQLEELTRLHTRIAETLDALEHHASAAAQANAAAAKARHDARLAYREFVRKQAEAAGFKIEPPKPRFTHPRMDR